MYTPEDCTQVSAVTAVGLVEGLFTCQLEDAFLHAALVDCGLCPCHGVHQCFGSSRSPTPPLRLIFILHYR